MWAKFGSVVVLQLCCVGEGEVQIFVGMSSGHGFLTNFLGMAIPISHKTVEVVYSYWKNPFG